MQSLLLRFTRFRAKLSFAVLMFLGLFTGLNAQVQSRTYQMVLRKLLKHSVPELSVPTLAQNPRAYSFFLDARDWREYSVSHLSDAIWVGYKDFELARVEKIPKDAPIVVYCSVGYRSEKVSEKLLAAGYTQVFNLYGGIFEWVNRKQGVVDMQGKATSRVHAYDHLWGTWLRIKKKQKVFH
jgi:rhodanese-related sulfurtransferase